MKTIFTICQSWLTFGFMVISTAFSLLHLTSPPRFFICESSFLRFKLFTLLRYTNQAGMILLWLPMRTTAFAFNFEIFWRVQKDWLSRLPSWSQGRPQESLQTHCWATIRVILQQDQDSKRWEERRRSASVMLGCTEWLCGAQHDSGGAHCDVGVHRVTQEVHRVTQVCSVMVGCTEWHWGAGCDVGVHRMTLGCTTWRWGAQCDAGVHGVILECTAWHWGAQLAYSSTGCLCSWLQKTN